MAESNTVMCLVCYKPLSFLRENEVPEEVIREFACGLRLNMGMIEHHGWMWCADCKYYTHLPTIVRLLEEYKEMAQRSKHDNRGKAR